MRKPVAQITVATSSVVPSSKLTVDLRGVDGPAMQLHAAATSQGPWRQADQRVPSSHPPPDPRRGRLANQAGRLQVPKQVTAQDPLRQRHAAIQSRDEPRARESSCAIWKPVLPPPTTSTRPVGMASGEQYAVLCNCVASTEALGDRGDDRHLEWAGGEYHLPGFIAAIVVQLGQIATARPPDRADRCSARPAGRSDGRSRLGTRPPRPVPGSDRDRRGSRMRAGRCSGPR